jgi:energy-converting hydrogenase Eha subunit C
MIDESVQKLGMYSFISMMLIIVFVISPLNKIPILSLLMKIIILCLLAYTGYLCNAQITFMKKATNASQSTTIKNQLTANILGEYVFILFLGLLFIFVLKSIL